MVKNNKSNAIVRLVVLVILMLNQALIILDYEPLPFDENQIYEGVSIVALVIAGIWNWWKNNNLTAEAQHAQIVLNDLKKERKRHG